MLTRVLLKILLTALAVMLASYIVPGIMVASLYYALIVAVVLGIVNLILRPILFILTLPVTIITLGLFTFVINAFLFWFVGTLIKGFSVNGFIPALLGSLIVSFVSALGNHLIRS